jgi:hypothetical protein
MNTTANSIRFKAIHGLKALTDAVNGMVGYYATLDRLPQHIQETYDIEQLWVMYTILDALDTDYQELTEEDLDFFLDGHRVALPETFFDFPTLDKKRFASGMKYFDMYLGFLERKDCCFTM